MFAYRKIACTIAQRQYIKGFLYNVSKLWRKYNFLIYFIFSYFYIVLLVLVKWKGCLNYVYFLYRVWFKLRKAMHFTSKIKYKIVKYLMTMMSCRLAVNTTVYGPHSHEDGLSFVFSSFCQLGKGAVELRSSKCNA